MWLKKKKHNKNTWQQVYDFFSIMGNFIILLFLKKVKGLGSPWTFLATSD